MASNMINWQQTFKVGTETLKNAAISIYLAGTSTAVTVYDVNDVAHTTTPQASTDTDGKVNLYFAYDEFIPGQLFDVYVSPDISSSVKDYRLLSLMLLVQDGDNLSLRNNGILYLYDTANTLVGSIGTVSDNYMRIKGEDGTELNFYVNNAAMSFQAAGTGSLTFQGDLLPTSTDGDDLGGEYYFWRGIYGSFIAKRKKITADYTTKAETVIGVDCSGGAVSVLLATADLTAGRLVIVKDEGGDAATNNITVGTEGSETIDGISAWVINSDYGSLKVYSDGSNWFKW